MVFEALFEPLLRPEVHDGVIHCIVRSISTAPKSASRTALPTTDFNPILCPNAAPAMTVEKMGREEGVNFYKIFSARSHSRCLPMPMMVLAAIMPDADAAGTPMPGAVLSPTQ